MEIRYLYASRFNKSWYFDFLEMFQWIEKYFCVSNQKIGFFNFKVYFNRFLYLHTFLRKTPWKLFDPFITFRLHSLQMWRMNYRYILKSFSVFLWNIFENITGMPLRGHLLAARSFILIQESYTRHLEKKKLEKHLFLICEIPLKWKIHGIYSQKPKCFSESFTFSLSIRTIR